LETGSNNTLVALGGLGACYWSQGTSAQIGPSTMDFQGKNMCSTTSFGEVKPSVPYNKILRHVKEHYEYERDTS
jgi:hypothetical protein